jgi:hypothetical protein
VRKSVFLIALAVSVALAAPSCLVPQAEALGGGTGAPSWYFTVPKAGVIQPRSFMIGLPYIEYSPTQNLEVGLHGLKYRFENLTAYPFALGVDPILSFAYAYAVWELPAGSDDVTLGFKVTPLFLLFGFEKQLNDNVSIVAEVNDGALAGLRVQIDPNWHVEFGAGVAAYGVWRADPFDHRGLHDYDFDHIDFEPTIWAGFAYSDFIGKYTE